MWCVCTKLLISFAYIFFFVHAVVLGEKFHVLTSLSNAPCSAARPTTTYPTEKRHAEALSEISACRDTLDAARRRLNDADAQDIKALPVLLGAVGKVQVSVDVCADRLHESITAPLREGGGSSAASDEPSLDTCKAKVEAVVAKVDEACAKLQQEQLHRQSTAQEEAARKAGDRWLMQARALRRAMLGPEGVGRRRDTGNQFQGALDKLDAALAEADRLRADIGAQRSPDGGKAGDAFAKAAQEASRAAEELQSAGEAIAYEESSRADGARLLVRMAFEDLAEIEADVKGSGLAKYRIVSSAVRTARAGIEEVFGALQEEGGAGATRRDKDRIETVVESGSLESALQTVDAARVAVSRARRVADAETEAREILTKESARVDNVSHRAEKLGLFERPKVVRAIQDCRAAATAAERLGKRVRQVVPAKREALVQEYMSAVLFAREATARAEETLGLEKETAAVNNEARRRVQEHLESSTATVALLQGRLDWLVAAAGRRSKSLEDVRVLAASWKLGTAGKKLRTPVPPEPCGKAASRATADAKKGLDVTSEEVETALDVTALGNDVKVCLERVTVAEAAVAEMEVRGRRRDIAIAGLERAAATTEAVIADTQAAAKMVGREAMVASVTTAVCQVQGALVEAVTSAELSGPGMIGVDDAFVEAATQAEQAAKVAAETFLRERMLVKQAEDERQERSAELYSAARRLEELDTGGVVGDDPEAAAMVLEARSEATQVRLESSWLMGGFAETKVLLFVMLGAQRGRPFERFWRTTYNKMYVCMLCFTSALRDQQG